MLSPKRPRAARKILFLALAFAAILACWIVLAPLLADALVVEKPLDKADAIVVLSGAADYAQRAQGGVEAFQLGIAPTVWITDDNQRGGWDDKVEGNPYFIERMRTELTQSGVPSDAVEKLTATVGSTNDEADLVIATAVERNLKGILVVTSDYHSLRALQTFERVVKNRNADIVVGLKRSPTGSTYPDRYTWWLTPRGWRSVAGEYVKLGWYWFYY